MFCPSCGTQASEGLRFCKQCGANLRRVQGVMAQGGGGLDWSKTWVAEMMVSEEERERQKGVTPEEKRFNEIKGGVITSSVGLGVMIFLYFFMDGLAAQPGNASDAELLRHIWMAGIIPFFVGLAIIFNGLFISKRIVELKRQPLPKPPQPLPLGAPTTDQLAEPAADFSVTEQTTTRLPEPVPARRETN
jgi:hypothetical protein